MHPSADYNVQGNPEDLHDIIAESNTAANDKEPILALKAAMLPRRSKRISKPPQIFRAQAFAAVTPSTTWTLVSRSNARNVLTNKWVFKRKDAVDEYGKSSVRYKARLVTGGFRQIHGIDYEETYAPVIKFTTLRLFFAVCAHLGLHVHQMDVITAFLNGNLKQLIFMEQPEGFVSENTLNTYVSWKSLSMGSNKLLEDRMKQLITFS
eukprot:IDg22787t1